MKNKYIVLLVLFALVSACTDKFEEFNTDQKNPAVVEGNALFTNATIALVDQISSTNVNLNIFKLMAQYWTETTYIDEANYDLVNRTIPDNIYEVYYRDILKDFKEASTLIAAEETVTPEEATAKQNRLHIIEMLNVYTWQEMVDIFGDIPYSQALNIDNISPVYDPAATIYTDLITRINTAINGLDPNGGSFGSADLIYGGDVESWIKFGNSLKLKIGIMLADVNPGTAQTLIEEAAAGAIGSAGDNALLPYESSTPNTNSIWEDLVQSGRNDFVGANTIVDIMNNLQDPRIFNYFSYPILFDYPRNDNNTRIDSVVPSGDSKFFIFDSYTGDDSVVFMVPPYTIKAVDSALNVRSYVGGQYGYTSPYANNSHLGLAIHEPTFPGVLMTYDEVQFYLAEAAARGFNVGGTPEEFYNEGITASVLYWGGTQLEAEEYLAQPKVAYATATGDWKQKIGTQAWIALYARGMQGYTTWRRLDYPIFNLPESVSDYSEIPVRFTYPVAEQTLNATNYDAASTAIGGDAISTKIFWDLH